MTLAASRLLAASLVLTDESLSLAVRVHLAKGEVVEAMTDAQRTLGAIAGRENEPDTAASGSPVPAPDQVGDRT